MNLENIREKIEKAYELIDYVAVKFFDENEKISEKAKKVLDAIDALTEEVDDLELAKDTYPDYMAIAKEAREREMVW